MTISASYAPDTYAGDGSTTSFAITFAFLSDGNNIKVTEKTDSTGALSVKTGGGTDYTVTGSNVVMNTAPASGVTLIIELNPDYKQETDYAENGNLPADTLENDLDKLCLEVQLSKDQADRAIRFDSAVDISSFTATIPATTADKFIKINSAGDGFELGTGDSILDSLDKSDGNFIVGDGTNFVVESGSTALASIGALANSGTPAISGTASAPAEIRLNEDTDNGTNYMGLAAPAAVTSSVTLTLPDGDGVADQVLKTDGSGNLGWVNRLAGGLANVADDTTPQLGGDLDTNSYNIQFDTAHGIQDDSGNEQITFTKTASAVNELTVTNAATGSGPSITSTGDDVNIDLTIDTAGTGSLNLGSADATVAVKSTMTVIDEIQHEGDTNNKIGFTTDTQTFTTGGSTRMDITDSGVQLGAANARVTTILDEDTMTSDSATALATQQSIKAYVDSNSGGAWVKISSSTASASATIDFTGLSGTYRKYMVVLENVLPATDNVDFYIRTSTDGGSTYDSGASDYVYSVTGQNNTAAFDTYSTGAAQILNNGSTQKISSATGEGINATYEIYNHASTYCEVIGIISYRGHSTNDTGVLPVAGRRAAAADVDGIRFLMSSGNIASGTFTLYGLST